MKYAGFWIRVLATIIDSTIVMLIVWPISYLQDGAATKGFGPFFSELEDSPVFTIIAITYLLISSVVVSRTLGKVLLGLHIVDANNGEVPTRMKLIVRLLGYIPSGVILNLGFLWVAFDARKQGWHDKLAGTIVVSS